MMALPLLIMAVWILPRRCVSAFAPKVANHRNNAIRLFASSSSYSISNVNLSRFSTLQTLLNKHGAPGSQNCKVAGDLQPVVSLQDMPELVAAMTGSIGTMATEGYEDVDLASLHPFLFPISQSKQSPDVFICAYRNPSTEESDKSFPWPIVETKLGGPGFRLLALNSEHLMRRIACESDASVNDGEATDIVNLYNEGIGKGQIADAALDTPYKVGSVAQLGYGVDKYVLLRVGPFPDLYEAMAQQHRQKGDEQSALIAAEACNKKLSGFASTFLFYARLLNSFPKRKEEVRDAARMCLRLPLPTIGMSYDDFKDVAVLGQIADESDSIAVVLDKLAKFFAKMREVETEEDSQKDGKTPVQAAIEQASLVLDEAALAKKSWSKVRAVVGDKLRSVGRDKFAQFVDYKSS